MADGESSTGRRLGELAALFLRLGTTAFGGPAAHIAMMEAEVVRKRAWLTREALLDLIGAVNLIPGPNSTELAIHIGHVRAGWLGLIVAGASFIFPAALITGVLGWMYVTWGALPEVGGVLYGVKPVIIAVVAQALVGLAPKAAKSIPLGVLGVLSAAAVVFGVNEVITIFAAGFGALALERLRAAPPEARASAPVLPAMGLLGGVATATTATTATTAITATTAATAAAISGAAAAAPITGSAIFLVFAKIGSVLFGSGYVLLAFLRADLVERLGWLTEAQLIDAVAVGQVTPGPVFTTATFIGYLLSGPSGAAIATAGIFLPAFVFVALSGPLVPRMRRSRLAGAFLDGVNVASLALMGVVAVQLARAAFVDLPAIAIGVASALLLVRFKVSSTWLIAAGAAIGLILPRG